MSGQKLSNQDLVSFNNNYAPGATSCIFGGGNDRVYSIQVPAGQRLIVDLTDASPTLDANLQLASSVVACGTTCEARVDDGVDGAEEHLYWRNTTGVAANVFIIVDHAAGHAGTFSITATIAPPLADDVCAGAVTLAAGSTVTNQTLADYSNDYIANADPNCNFHQGNDRAYAVTVPAGMRLTAALTNASPTLDATLQLVDGVAACGTSCVSGADRGVGGEDEVLVWVNSSGSTKTMLLVVDRFTGKAGTYSLSATVDMPAAGDACVGAVTLTPGTPATAQTTTGFVNDYASGTSCAFYSGGDRVYRVTVPDGQVLQVAASMVGPSLDVALNLVASESACGVSCLASTDRGADGASETVTWKNTTGASATVLIIVDTYQGTGFFDLLATVFPPPGDDVCQGATPLGAGQTLSNQTTVGYSNSYQTGSGTSTCPRDGFFENTSGPDRVYSLTVPAGQRGAVTVAPEANYNTNVGLVAAPASTCDVSPRVCVANASTSSSGVAETARYFNVSGGPQTLFAIVDGDGPGGFAISFATSAPAADDTCTTSSSILTSGAALSADLTGFENDYASGPGCARAGGPDRVYRATVPSGQKLSVSVTPADVTGLDPVLNLIKAPASMFCDGLAPSCVASADVGATGDAEAMAWVNQGPSAQDVYLVVDSYEVSPADSRYSLTATIAAAATGETCSAPIVISGPVTLMNQTLSGFSRELTFDGSNTGCFAFTGPDVFYQVTIPAGQTLTAVATPSSNVNLDMNLIGGPASNCTNTATCLANAHAAGAGAAETLTYGNTSGTTQTVFLLVTGTSTAVFSLSLQIQ